MNCPDLHSNHYLLQNIQFNVSETLFVDNNRMQKSALYVENMFAFRKGKKTAADADTQTMNEPEYFYSQTEPTEDKNVGWLKETHQTWSKEPKDIPAIEQSFSSPYADGFTTHMRTQQWKAGKLELTLPELLELTLPEFLELTLPEFAG